MPVKDLVSAYETRASPSQRPSSRNTRTQTNQENIPAVDGLPGPSLHRTSQVYTGTGLSNYSTSSLTGSTTIYDDATTDTQDTLLVGESTADVTDELYDLHSSAKKRHELITKFSKLPQDADVIEMKRLLPGKNPPNDPDFEVVSDNERSMPSADSSIKCGPRSNSSHTANPVAAATVFARGAAPLSFLELDAYLSTLSPPAFHSQTRKDGKPAMFIPFHLLAASGKTLDDLEKNAQIPHWWQNRNTIIGALASLALSITGASALVSFYSLRGLIDMLQIFALVLNTIAHGVQLDTWKKIILGTIPNVLALNFATSTRLATIILIVLILFVGVVFYFFIRATSACCRAGIPEGLQVPEFFPYKWRLVLMSFVLTVLYLPLSTMAMHVMVWSDDLWVVPNPYTNTSVSPTDLPPLGPADEFLGPLDFCYTTTMKRNELNYAPALVILAIVTLIGFTIGFPIQLYRTIKLVYPKVDLYTELGGRRSNSELDREYQRLLDRDRNPLQFLYHEYRRGWATYEALYLCAKLAALLVVAVVDPDNCLFRSLPRSTVMVARQIALLFAMTGFFLVQCFLSPFNNPVSNASEWVSRLNYVLTAVIALCVALNVPGEAALSGPILYIVYIVTYGMGVYFTVIGWSFMQRVVKRLARRIDFSIDVFSPRIDLSPTSPHTKRRIWQETISTLFLTSPECGIPKSQRMKFVQARDSEYPPYLLDFAGTPGERHVENLKILREVGTASYTEGAVIVSGTGSARLRHLLDTIQRHYVGPDSYWKSPSEEVALKCKGFFGNAWFIPFPPTVVIRYDDGPLVTLGSPAELELYVKQNSSHDIQRRREIRMALRALDGLVVSWPYEHVQPIGSRRPFFGCCPGRRYRARMTYHYRAAIFRIKRRGNLTYERLDLGSGFDIELTYAKSVIVDGSVIGLNDDFDLTTPLARFLTLNEELINNSLPRIETVLERYRHHGRKECREKADTLSYRFLTAVYDKPQEPAGVTESSIEFERDLRVRTLMVESENAIQIAYDRLAAVSASELSVWWYIFWDDLWRRNYDTIKALETHASDFDPHYPSSIAYTPLPRAALESFLTQRGLYHKQTKWGDFFHSGFLNKIYLRMNDILFHGRKEADIIRLGHNTTDMDMEDVDAQTLARPSTLGTGGGTDHDDESIRARPVYRWEGILDDPLRTHKQHRPNMWSKLAVWMGLTPLWRSGVPSMGLALDVRLDHGQYVPLHHEEDEQSFVKGYR